jgi:hypothetical protein
LLHSGISGIAHSSLIPNSQARASIGDANVVISGYNMTSSVIGSISRGTRVRGQRSLAVDRACERATIVTRYRRE